jgi:hypothetical protein
VIRRLAVFTLFVAAIPAPAQNSDRRDLDDVLGPNTVQELSNRLMKMQGKFDPNTLKTMLERMMVEEQKKNPNVTKEELFKKAAQQSGLSQAQIDTFLPMMSDPAFLEKLKGMMGNGGKGLGGGFPTAQLEDLTKQVNAKAPKFNTPKFDASGFQTSPNLPNLPKGSMPDLSPTAKNVMGFWENNFGSLNESPAVKDAIQRMFASGINADGTPTNFFGYMEQSGYSSQGFANWMNSSSSSSGWHWPNWLGGGGSGGSYGGGSWSWGSGSGSSPSTSSNGIGEGGTWWSVIILVVVAGGGLVLWWLWPRLMQGSAPKDTATVAARFDIDPNAVIDRETLVKVFEALSLSLIGDDAKVWTHSTIGQALREFLATNPSAADRLALIYALARYTPVDDPFPANTISEAKTHLGTLAGVPKE